ncbi:hypothetical protein JTE90_012377 [Oedothorax gibbosus]|uniref:Uncharacterized protein n=1 Tax=Oedothorax gibbosus TaxID=931172 RepID=A0AAV6TNA8_9ARAC|nr:hypothetical protein JTE90_012377 [Oedothorax gibbosus]
MICVLTKPNVEFVQASYFSTGSTGNLTTWTEKSSNLKMRRPGVPSQWSVKKLNISDTSSNAANALPSTRLRENQKQMQMRAQTAQTRWNSTHNMIDHFVKNEEPILITPVVLESVPTDFHKDEWELVKRPYCLS